jgi:L-amino acid N-acyltransferase YncA
VRSIRVRAHAGVVEHSIYVAPDARGLGVGRALLAALIGSAEAAGIWTIQAGVFPENTASLALHAAAGFRVVGVRSGSAGTRSRRRPLARRRGHRTPQPADLTRQGKGRPV